MENKVKCDNCFGSGYDCKTKSLCKKCKGSGELSYLKRANYRKKDKFVNDFLFGFNK